MRRLIRAVAAITAMSTFAAPAMAQGYPSHPITMIVPFAAGGPVDVLARIVGERMGVALGQPVIIENVAGAAGSIGVGRVARAAGDGYTLSIGPGSSTHVVNGAIFALSYDVVKDFEPVSLIGTPYRGLAPAMQDLLAGQVDLMIDVPTSSLPHVRAAAIKAFAVTAKNRLASAPDIPTVDEAGLPGLHASAWYALWAPKGTPKEVIARLNGAIVEALADPETRTRLADIGQEIVPRDQQTPEALAALQKVEIEKWWPIIKAANITGQ